MLIINLLDWVEVKSDNWNIAVGGCYTRVRPHKCALPDNLDTYPTQS